MATEVMIWGIFGIAMAIAISTYWAQDLRIRRALQRAPRAKVGDATEGQLARLDGQVVDGGGEVLLAPLTGRRCVYYVAIVETRVRKRNHVTWRPRIREERSVPFAIDDGTGRAVIDLGGTHLDVEIDQGFTTTKSGEGSTDSIDEPFFTRHALRAQPWFGDGVRYREGVIAVGETIAVAGHPVREPDPDAAARATGYRDGLATRLRLRGSKRHPLLISDARDPKR